MKRVITLLIAALLILGIAGCGAAEPRQEPPVQTTPAVPDATETTVSPTPSPTLEVTPTPPPCPLTSSVADAMDVPEGEAGAAKYHDFEHDGLNRTYLLYIPEGIRKDAPLVFVMHGYLDMAYNFMNTTGMNAVADKYGFGVVYPQGSSSKSQEFAGTHWNADFTFSEVDDVGFLTALAEYLQESYGFGSGKTFACGLSNGGFMSYTLAVKSPDTFRAVASVAGTMSNGTWNDRDSSSDVVPVLQIHGTADTTVPIDGTMTTAGGWGGAPKMDDIISYWADRNGAGPMEEQTSDGVTARVYSNGEGKNLVEYYLIDGFGHKWPNVQNSGLDTSELIWRFFSNYLD